MAAREAYGYSNEAAATAEAATSTARPGAGSLLALMWIAACAMAGWRHEDIVVALMAQGILNESTVLGGLTIMKWASVAGAAIGLAAMLPAMLWALTTVGRWGPVRASAAQVSHVVTPIATPLVMATAAVVTGVAGMAHSLVGYAGTAIYGLARGAVLVGAFALHYLTLGVTSAATAARSVLDAIWAATVAVVEFVSPAFVLTGRALALLATLAGQGLAAAYAVVRQTAVYVLQIAGLAARLLEQLARFALGRIRTAAVAAARIATPVLVYTLRILGRGLSALAGVFGLVAEQLLSVVTATLHLLNSGFSVVAAVASRAIAYTWRAVAAVVSRLGVIAMAAARAAVRAGVFVLQQASTALATAFSYFSAGVSIGAHVSVLAAGKLAVATGAVIVVAWLGSVIVAVAAGNAVILVGRSLFTILHYLWAVVWWATKAVSKPESTEGHRWTA